MLEKIALILAGLALTAGSGYFWKKWNSHLKKGTHTNGKVVGYEEAMDGDKWRWFPIVEFLASDGSHVRKKCSEGIAKKTYRIHELVEIVHNPDELFILKENQSVLLLCIMVSGITMIAIGLFWA